MNIIKGYPTKEKLPDNPERPLFEEWAHRNMLSIERAPSGIYRSPNTLMAWISWNAAIRSCKNRL